MHESSPDAIAAACDLGTPAAICARQLSKRFGDQRAVQELSFQVPPGQIVGLLGPNGAGKSTTLKMLTGVLEPCSGTVHIAGFDLAREPLEAKRRIGFAPESGGVFESLTGLEYLDLIGALHGMPRSAQRERVGQLSDVFDLDAALSSRRLIGSYSKGMRRKLVITAALIHEPPVLMFDEPLDGLDASSSVSFKSLLRSLARAGTTIIYSSHLMEVVERLCDRVIIIDQGRLLLDGAPDELVASNGASTLEHLFIRVTRAGSHGNRHVGRASR